MKITKSIYGLKQANKQWNTKLTSVLNSLGFIQAKSDYSLYTKGSDSQFVAILVYVDDIILVSPNISIINSVKSQLSCKAHKFYDYLMYFN